MRAENARLKAKESLKAMSSLFAPHDPLMRRQLISRSSSSPLHNTQLEAVALESKLLARDAAQLGCEPRLVNVAIDRGAGGRKKWTPLVTEPVLQYHERTFKLQRISRSGMELRERVRKIAESYGLSSVSIMMGCILRHVQ